MSFAEETAAAVLWAAYEISKGTTEGVSKEAIARKTGLSMDEVNDADLRLRNSGHLMPSFRGEQLFLSAKGIMWVKDNPPPPDAPSLEDEEV